MLVNNDLVDFHSASLPANARYWPVPSLDASIDLAIARKLNAIAQDLPNTHTIIISVDTPYAQGA